MTAKPSTGRYSARIADPPADRGRRGGQSGTSRRPYGPGSSAAPWTQTPP
jgi:hypothetical protein